MQGIVQELEPHQVICREGDPAEEIYFLQKGKLLICTTDGTKVKVISRISAGEFIGELSLFDGKVRGSSVITLEKSTILRISKHEISDNLPAWLAHIGASLTKKIRLLDNVIHHSNLRLSSDEQSKPLSIEEQRKFFDLLSNENA